MLIPYGRSPRVLELPGRTLTEVAAAPLPPHPPLAALLDRALAEPLGRPRLEDLVRRGDRVTVVVSDPTREEPRAALLAAVRARLPEVELTVAIATGTHGPARLERLGLPPALLAGARVVNHDGHAPADMVPLGVTGHGTRVHVHRCAVEADLVIATGCLRPHYFAGFGAGIKAIFPGLGDAASIRHNHLLKRHPRARAGIIQGNPCRDDLDEAVRLLPAPLWLLDGVCDPTGAVRDVVAGDPWAAFLVGVERARPWFTVRAAPARVVIASDAWPVTASLYQAAKIAAAAAPLVAEGGLLIVAAECAEGIGPLDVVNDGILRPGVLPRLRDGVRLGLLSGLLPEEVRKTPCEVVDDLARWIPVGADVLVVPSASLLLCEPLDAPR